MIIIYLRYNFCGPGTKLQQRLLRNDVGINQLDEACKLHDIVYENSANSKERNKADKKLVSKAFKRVYSKDVKLGERSAALLVSALVGAKVGLSKIGLGIISNTRMAPRKSRSRRTTTTKRKRERTNGRRKQSSVKFGGSVRRGARKRVQKKRVTKKTRVLRLPPRFVGMYGGSGMYLKPYQR